MSRIEVSRDVVAEPSSVALVLAGPAAREQWPHRSNRLVGLVGSQAPRLSVDLDPPRRAGVGFTAGIRVRAADEVVASGRLVIDPGERSRCRLRMSLLADDAVVERLQRDADRYLANVATLTRERSSAA